MASRIYGRAKEEMDYSLVATAVFTPVRNSITPPQTSLFYIGVAPSEPVIMTPQLRSEYDVR